MFQSFDVTTRPDTAAPRVASLRTAMAEAGIDMFLVPRADRHRGENVAPCDERLAWISGFTGSAGHAAIGTKEAAIFVDGRYTLQVQTQVDRDIFTYKNMPDDPLADWIKAVLEGGGRVGFDPWLHTKGEIDKLRTDLGDGFELVATDNLIDRIWEGRPAEPTEPISAYPIEFAGQSSEDKRQDIAASLSKDGVAAVVLTLPDSIAWLCNLRGGDIARTPVFRAMAVLYADAALDVFVTDITAVDDDAILTFGTLASKSRFRPMSEFIPTLAPLAGKVMVDKNSAPVAVESALTKAEIVWKRDPCILPKAQKNPVEIQGSRDAHRRDGAAMVEFLAWLDANAPGGGLTEIDVARKLESFRGATNGLRDISFDTISGAGANGAIVHYRVTEDSNATLAANSLFLIDSGGQYLDGTTDITRTVAIGTPPADAIKAFTLVLKGMIGISVARFPSGLAGRDIDAMARAALWAQGMDYDHGTGHGVGAYLGVHEGPAAISRRSHEPILPGMILSNEPGYYREGAFGIRIENLIAVNAPTRPDGGDREMLSFETLTYVPIDRRLIDPALLTRAEREWINAYHAETRGRLFDAVSTDAAAWLDAATTPI